ncbi:hypothetical protein G7Y89_g7872 [Cudoniella acicularis]|uniref:Zn(2)-C6 fungal-type domain-containing protein n=1 Tax=Cudoniella acicularis TaxID=354080 RepID=A0A8H4RJ87_9HELO|nr:hypothetical protein G7Y89_g7872 [Cudoniella acicularis]
MPLTLPQCDENKPLCNNCHRHGVPCSYRNPTQSSSKSLSSNPIKPTEPVEPAEPVEPVEPEIDLLQEYDLPNLSLGPPDIHEEWASETPYSSEIDDVTIFDLRESTSRRLLELRLLQNYITETSKTFGACHHAAIRHTWSVEIPKLAFQNVSLLYQIFSISALHLLKSEPDNRELLIARETYQGLASREHRRAVAKLSSKSADAVCCTSSLIFIDAFASLQERAIEPYEPPMGWLYMARGAGSIFKIGIDNLLDPQDRKEAKILAISDPQPYFENANKLFEEENRGSLLGLLTQDIPGEEWNQATREAYEKALSYIGWVQRTIDDGENVLGVCRRFMAFAILAPKSFIEFVEERRPRALVILAHFFALGFQMREIWWVGKTVQREIQGIQNVLPPEWQPLMVQPCLKAGLIIA